MTGHAWLPAPAEADETHPIEQFWGIGTSIWSSGRHSASATGDSVTSGVGAMPGGMIFGWLGNRIGRRFGHVYGTVGF